MIFNKSEEKEDVCEKENPHHPDYICANDDCEQCQKKKEVSNGNKN